MRNTTKKLLGFIGLALVVLLTIVAIFMPTEGVYAEGTAIGTDTIRVTVYDQYPAVTIDDPETDFFTISPVLTATFTYENSSYVDFTLSYVDENGDVVEIALPQFVPDPERLDPIFLYDSDTQTITINLRDYDLSYNHYVLSAVSGSPIGVSAGDSIEFDYVPAMLVQTGTDENTNDPIVEVSYDDGVAKVEIMPVDDEGNPLLDEPIVIEVEPDENGNYPTGSQTITLPYTENGLEDGNYTVIITAYNGDDEELPTTRPNYPTTYEQPQAPEAPNTGAFLGKLNIAKSDYVITTAIVFAAFAAIAFRLITRKKKDYRKNISSRK